MITPYATHILILIGIYTILTSSLNLAIGFTGLLNLGHIAFFGIGAYTSALLTLAGVPFIVAFVAAGLTSAIFGFLLMVATRRLSGDYLALATLGFAFVVSTVLLNWTSVTRGPLGIPGIPKPQIFNLTISSNYAYLIFTLSVAAITVLLLHRLTASRYGRLLEAIRDDQLAAASLGKPVFKIKAQSLGISAFFAGIAGSLFAHYLTFIDPTSFFIPEIILTLTIVMVGGLASLPGTIVATAIILLIPELLRFVDFPPGVIGPLRQIIYAAILLGIILVRPRGLFGRVDLE